MIAKEHGLDMLLRLYVLMRRMSWEDDSCGMNKVELYIARSDREHRHTLPSGGPVAGPYGQGRTSGVRGAVG